jgi:hypothetical protein
MPCALTQGYTLPCKDNAGGVKNIWLMELENVSGITASNGLISGITKTTGKRFWKYVQERGVAESKEEFQVSTENGTQFVSQTVDMVINKMEASRRNELSLLVQVRTVAVVQDRNDKYWYYGESNGLELTAGQAGTGKAMGDRNGYNWSLTGEEPLLAKEVSAGAVATLETAG